MEKRLAELERRGVEATLEMQQAARTVAMENSRLKMLLQRQGISPMEITNFLESFQHEDQYADDLSRSDDEHKPDVQGQWLGAPSSRHHRDLVDKLSVLADASVSESSASGQRSSGSVDSNIASPHSSRTVTMPTTPSQHHHDDPHMRHQPPSSPLLMSCNTAAQIIAQMQGTGTTDQYKAKMGCKQECECLVKNTLLFQIMDGHGPA